MYMRYMYMYMYVPVADPGMLPGLIWLVIMAHQLGVTCYFSVHVSSAFVNIVVYIMVCVQACSAIVK